MGRLLNVTVVQNESHYTLTRVRRIESVNNISAYESEDSCTQWEYNLKCTDLLIESEADTNKLLYIIDRRPKDREEIKILPLTPLENEVIEEAIIALREKLLSNEAVSEKFIDVMNRCGEYMRNKRDEQTN